MNLEKRKARRLAGNIAEMLSSISVDKMITESERYKGMAQDFGEFMVLVLKHNQTVEVHKKAIKNKNFERADALLQKKYRIQDKILEELGFKE